MENKPNLQSRLDAVFGSLGQSSWAVCSNVETFKPGKDVDEYSSDDEAERTAPQSVMPARMIDSEDGEEELQECRAQANCSASYRKAFEKEEEEDAFDRFAAGNAKLKRSGDGVLWQGDPDDDKPEGNMEVIR